MINVEPLIPFFALAILIERILETGFNVFETVPAIKKWIVEDTYRNIKQILTIIVGVIVGIIISNQTGVLLFAAFGFVINTTADMVLTGLIAGVAAPYAHVILQALSAITTNLNSGEARKETQEEINKRLEDLLEQVGASLPDPENI